MERQGRRAGPAGVAVRTGSAAPRRRCVPHPCQRRCCPSPPPLPPGVLPPHPNPLPPHLQRRLHGVQPRLDAALLLRHAAVQRLALRLRRPQRRLLLGPANGGREGGAVLGVDFGGATRATHSPCLLLPRSLRAPALICRHSCASSLWACPRSPCPVLPPDAHLSAFMRITSCGCTVCAATRARSVSFSASTPASSCCCAATSACRSASLRCSEALWACGRWAGAAVPRGAAQRKA